VSFSQLSFALWRLCHQCLGVLADKIFEQVRQLFIAEVTNPGGQPEWQQLILCKTAGKLIRQSDLAVKTLRRRKEAHLLQQVRHLSEVSVSARTAGRARTGLFEDVCQIRQVAQADCVGVVVQLT
jgi:hypothetical protein